MIRCHLSGGLGNQMFQFAMAYAMAKRAKAELRLNTYLLSEKYRRRLESPREYELSVFPRLANMRAYAPTFDVEEFMHFRNPLARACLRLHRFANRFFRFCVHEGAGLNLDEIFHPAHNRPYHIYGYWQSEDYFRDCADDIRNLFEFPPLAEAENQRVADAICACGDRSVGIHVRRGDYVSSPGAAGLLGNCCPISYYESAVRHIQKILGDGDVSFFVFSDDIPWVRENMSFPGRCAFIDWNGGGKSFRDMQLMSLCRHHVIANSTFSWWGAWLGEKRDSVTIAPPRWYSDDKQQEKYGTSIIPARWRGKGIDFSRKCRSKLRLAHVAKPQSVVMLHHEPA